MEQVLEVLAHYTSLAIDVIAVVIVAVGTIETTFAVFRVVVGAMPDPGRRALWLRYARWLSAGLTFQLAADIVHTSIRPSWDEVGRLAATAAIRTFLTVFLDRDIEARRQREAQ